ncbi:hypothetical protein A6A12_2493 [Vibrio anguillarum]|nr:hypothetical protein A6A12_2493 [Vibrio anguillarum]
MKLFIGFAFFPVGYQVHFRCLFLLRLSDYATKPSAGSS